ncbi:hypothetical protein CVN76_05695 [Bacillus sp. mrc49]|nr:hypothetical protein CVN76_05695 [Bacillus sp. mrc49]
MITFYTVSIYISFKYWLRFQILIGMALILIVFFSSNIIEKRLKNIEKQNIRVIEILEEIRDKE